MLIGMAFLRRNRPKQAEQSSVTPPVDLDRPVENPELVEQLRRSHEPPTEEELRRILQMLRDAVFLIATQMSHPDGRPPVIDGTMRAGTQINVHGVRLPGDRSALAVYTDWPSLRAAVGEGPDWSSLVQTGEEVFKMGLDPDYPGGVVIDPFGPEVTFAMEPAQISWMYANTRPRR
jgi:hypothetical protein